MDDWASPDDLDILTRTVIGEARGETHEGRVAVAVTIINRFFAKRWFSGRTLAATAQKPWQYSCWNMKDSNRLYILNVGRNALVYRLCHEAVEQAIREHDAGQRPGSVTAKLQGATHYFNPAVVKTPAWAAGREPTAIIGAHHFYGGIT
jgi:spore germination cell wall hydrolase CwlJ-like protein